MAKIIAPNKAYNGVSASVPFVNGIGETSDAHLLEWFRTHGYEVEEEKPNALEDEKAKEAIGFKVEEEKLSEAPEEAPVEAPEEKPVKRGRK